MNEIKNNDLIDRLLKNRVLSHILFWIAMIALYSQVLFHAQGSFWYGFVNNAVLFPSIIGASYFLVYYQIPRYIYTKKYLQFGISMLLSAYVF